MSKFLLTTLFVLSFSDGYAFETKQFEYSVRAGDTLSEITLMFEGHLNYLDVAKSNNIKTPDLIYPGNKIIVKTKNPASRLSLYLEAIYAGDTSRAYSMLSSKSQTKYSLDTFGKSVKETTFFDLGFFELTDQTQVDGQTVVQIKVQMEEDPATWSFNLIRENKQWRILLLDLHPTFPQDDDILDEGGKFKNRNS